MIRARRASRVHLASTPVRGRDVCSRVTHALPTRSMAAPATASPLPHEMMSKRWRTDVSGHRSGTRPEVTDVAASDFGQRLLRPDERESEPRVVA